MIPSTHVSHKTPHGLDSLARLRSEVIACRQCPRLVFFRESTAQTKKNQFSNWDYWGKPVPGFGSGMATLLIVGLAPAAHGGNRTGRVFTGDKSGDFLVRALFNTGFANQETSQSRADGLTLQGAYLTAAVKCAPPDNKPSTREIRNCSTYLIREVNLLRSVRAILCLGQVAYQSTVRILLDVHNLRTLKPTIPPFRHGLELLLGPGIPRVFASYHPSPRNTQTGKLTEDMFLSLLRRVRKTTQGD